MRIAQIMIHVSWRVKGSSRSDKTLQGVKHTTSAQTTISKIGICLKTVQSMSLANVRVRDSRLLRRMAQDVKSTISVLIILDSIGTRQKVVSNLTHAKRKAKASRRMMIMVILVLKPQLALMLIQQSLIQLPTILLIREQGGE